MELAHSAARTERFRSLRSRTTVFSPISVNCCCRSGITIRRLHASRRHSRPFHRRFPRFHFLRCPALPSSNLVALCETYCSVLSQGDASAMLERDSRSGQPLWMLLFTLLRSGCTHDVIEAYQDDILRHGGAVGHDIYRLLVAFVE